MADDARNGLFCGFAAMAMHAGMHVVMHVCAYGCLWTSMVWNKVLFCSVGFCCSVLLCSVLRLCHIAPAVVTFHPPEAPALVTLGQSHHGAAAQGAPARSLQLAHNVNHRQHWKLAAGLSSYQLAAGGMGRPQGSVRRREVTSSDPPVPAARMSYRCYTSSSDCYESPFIRWVELTAPVSAGMGGF